MYSEGNSQRPDVRHKSCSGKIDYDNDDPLNPYYVCDGPSGELDPWDPCGKRWRQVVVDGMSQAEIASTFEIIPPDDGKVFKLEFMPGTKDHPGYTFLRPATPDETKAYNKRQKD